ncbi:hypothetical protein CVT25_004517 [Psilocybe cyanescens]|uniref:Uncharacterized protein n=1 Tax=Psilocybe cyanescens TaxID=93625 RepID=A0A409XRK8_PSICY|nr:hypothetical protein CVT25_004517 [Psilocybe cyanescens]
MSFTLPSSSIISPNRVASRPAPRRMRIPSEPPAESNTAHTASDSSWKRSPRVRPASTRGVQKTYNLHRRTMSDGNAIGTLNRGTISSTPLEPLHPSIGEYWEKRARDQHQAEMLVFVFNSGMARLTPEHAQDEEMSLSTSHEAQEEMSVTTLKKAQEWLSSIKEEHEGDL